jgi:hypothetical protein
MNYYIVSDPFPSWESIPGLLKRFTNVGSIPGGGGGGGARAPMAPIACFWFVLLKETLKMFWLI